jgi:UDP-glucose 4-epimerase
MSKNVLITGANGFLGRAIARSHPADWRMIALVRSGQMSPLPEFAAVFDLAELLHADRSFDVVLHLAARIPDRANPEPADLRATNVELVERLLRKYPDARHVLASSVSAFGRPVVQRLSINTPSEAPAAYGASKLAAEQAISAAGRHAILRFSSLIGCGMKTGSFIPSAVAGARSGTIRLFGDGQRLQDYLDIDDAAAMCIQAAEHDGSFRALAVSGQPYSNLQVANILAGLTGATVVFSGADATPSYTYEREADGVLSPPRKSLATTLEEMIKA